MFLGFGFAYLLKSISVLLFVLVLANILLKKLNQTMTHKQSMIEIIERVPTGKSSSLSIVKIGEKNYVMSLSESENTILKELSQEEVDVMLEMKAQEKQVAADFFDNHTPSFMTEFKEKLEKRLKS